VPNEPPHFPLVVAQLPHGAAGGGAVIWNTSLPDSDVTVLVRLADEETPVWPCFHDGEFWRTADASTVCGPVAGWMHLEDAAKLLDGGAK
jgi:hypothetical protein